MNRPLPNAAEGFARALSRVTFIGILFIVVWAPMPLGSNRVWSEQILIVMVGVLCVIQAFYFAISRQKHPVTRAGAPSIILFLGMLWLGWLYCQIQPFPLTVLAELSPAAAAVWTETGLVLGTISLDPEITREMLNLSIAYLLLMVLVIGAVNRDKRLKILLWVLVISGTFQAVFGSLMVLSGRESLLFQSKESYLGTATGTFINRNHLAGYLGICLSAGIGLLISQMGSSSAETWRQRLREWVDLAFSAKIQLRVLLALMVIGLVLTRSRMGNVSFFAALSICGFLYLLLRERKHFIKGFLLILSLLLIDLWIVGSWFGLDKVVERLEQTNVTTESRSIVFGDLVPMIQDYKLAGSGLGSFESVYPAYRSPLLSHHHQHAHNDYAQFLIETGYIGCVILFLIAVLLIIHAWVLISRRRNRLANGVGLAVLMSLSCLALHSAVDFNLQIPANALTFVVLMSVSLTCASQSQSKRHSRAVWRSPAAGRRSREKAGLENDAR